MASPRITSITDLSNYILKKLGFPVVNIELTSDQITEAIHDTLEDYIERAYSGTEKRYIPIQFTPGVHDYILPYSVFAVTSVNTIGMSGIGNGIASNMFSINQFIAADLYKPGIAKIDIAGYEMINQMISTLDIIFSAKLDFDFNSISKILHIPSETVIGDGNDKAIIEVFQKLDIQDGYIDPAASGRFLEENIFNERWIKRMSLARAKQQWGWNLIKYDGSVLPNGGQLNGQFIYSEGKAEVEALWDELHNLYELPADFMIGIFALCSIIALVWQLIQPMQTVVT